MEKGFFPHTPIYQNSCVRTGFLVSEFPLDSLNPQQREAVVTTEGPLLVVAGPGSGKTRVITHRIGYLIREKEIPAWQIFAATFTNKAAREMRHRVYDLLDPTSQARLSISTFHSLCARLLRREAEKVGLSPRYSILDENDQKAVVKSCMQQMEIDTKSLTPAQALAQISLAKIRLLKPEEAGDLFEGPRQGEYLEIYDAYEKTLASNDAVDFDDLLLKVVRLFESDPDTLDHYKERFRYLLVDEYQDTNLVQCRLIDCLAGERKNVCVVGDEDQSIYSWRGAEIANLLNFQQTYPGAPIIRLEQNYRSTGRILALADSIIVRNTERIGKTLRTENEEGSFPVKVSCGTAQAEAAFVVDQIKKLRLAEGIPYSETGVFYRINALSRSVEDRLRAEDIPYRVIGGIKFYDRLEVKDVLAYLQTVANPESGLALSRIINKPKRGIGDVTLRKLESFALHRGIPLCATLTNDEALALVSKKASKTLRDFSGMIEDWRRDTDKLPLGDLAQKIMEDVGYIESLGDAASLEAITRSQNIDELLASMREYEKTADSPSLSDYLEMIALTSSVDEMDDRDDVVSLMTLHAAKGLEFRAVFMIGLEEGLFPSPRAIAERGNIEEERRLFYVGVTRAKERLYVSAARIRQLYGRDNWTTPSVFLHEMENDLCESVEDAEAAMVDSVMARSHPGPPASFGPRRAHKKRKPKALPNYAIGQRVEHLFLGQGKIIDIVGEGDGQKLHIKFEDGELSEIVARYGDLRILG